MPGAEGGKETKAERGERAQKTETKREGHVGQGRTDRHDDGGRRVRGLRKREPESRVGAALEGRGLRSKGFPDREPPDRGLRGDPSCVFSVLGRGSEITHP